MATAAPDTGTLTERRVAWLTLAFGFAAATATSAVTRNNVWAAGLAIGTVLAWLNFRWLRRGLDALVAASIAQSETAKPRVPIGAYFRALFRYALLALI